MVGGGELQSNDQEVSRSRRKEGSRPKRYPLLQLVGAQEVEVLGAISASGWPVRPDASISPQGPFSTMQIWLELPICLRKGGPSVGVC